MGEQLHRIAETLAEPDAVTASEAGPDVRLYYRRYSHLPGRRRYICVVTRVMTDYSFILTSFPDRRIKGVPA